MKEYDVFPALKNPPVKRKQWEASVSYCNFITNIVRKTAWVLRVITLSFENINSFNENTILKSRTARKYKEKCT